MFKTVDEKFAEIGFVKVEENDCLVRYEREENDYLVRYEREDENYNFTHVLAIINKVHGPSIIQSYDKDLMDTEGIGNTCVGLTYYEMKLAMKKMKELGYRRF